MVIESCRTRNPLTPWTVPVLVHVRCGCTYVIPGDPQSVQLRNATTTPALFFHVVPLAHLLLKSPIELLLLFTEGLLPRQPHVQFDPLFELYMSVYL